MKKFKKGKQILKNIIFKIGETPLPFLFILIFLSILIGGLVFYEYGWLPEKEVLSIAPKPLKFQKTLYQNILKEWESRQEKFEKIDSKEYLDLFQPLISETLTE